ncbi:MAG: hypothetical protein JXA28_05885 [Bacteroidetes bacterium]|nr:hypothetical protein [Bacteroidota bacterium]
MREAKVGSSKGTTQAIAHRDTAEDYESVENGSQSFKPFTDRQLVEKASEAM